MSTWLKLECFCFQVAGGFMFALLPGSARRCHLQTGRWSWWGPHSRQGGPHGGGAPSCHGATGRVAGTLCTGTGGWGHGVRAAGHRMYMKHPEHPSVYRRPQSHRPWSHTRPPPWAQSHGGQWRLGQEPVPRNKLRLSLYPGQDTGHIDTCTQGNNDKCEWQRMKWENKEWQTGLRRSDDTEEVTWLLKISAYWEQCNLNNIPTKQQYICNHIISFSYMARYDV